MVTVGVVRHRLPLDRRVALVPDGVDRLTRAGIEVLVESGAGAGAWYGDEAYAAAGADIVTTADLVDRADVVATVTRPDAGTLAMLRSGQTLLGLLDPDPDLVADLTGRGVRLACFEGLPRTLSRAQSMDALTSQANVAGYKSVLVAANAFGRYLPMLVTAAGTARPARVLVLGAGVAGLQAIGTARRLGAVVAAYDVRPESRAEIASVGATFLDLAAQPPGDGEGGYARALSDDEERIQRDALTAHIAAHDIVITTARVPGRRPPLLVGEEAVKAMAAGSVLVDMAAGPDGGNVFGSHAGQTVVTPGGVTVVGADDLAAQVPVAASDAYSRNVTALLLHLVHDGALVFDPADEICAGVVIGAMS